MGLAPPCCGQTRSAARAASPGSLRRRRRRRCRRTPQEQCERGTFHTATPMICTHTRTRRQTSVTVKGRSKGTPDIHYLSYGMTLVPWLLPARSEQAQVQLPVHDDDAGAVRCAYAAATAGFGLENCPTIWRYRSVRCCPPPPPPPPPPTPPPTAAAGWLSATTLALL